MASIRIKSLLVLCLSLFTLAFSGNAFANEKAESHEAKTEGHEAKAFNVTETILDHIKDDHSWHLWGETSLSLPVILYTPKGFEVFSSAKFMNEHHEHIVYKGNFDYKIIEGKVKIVKLEGATEVVDVEASKGLWDFSITKNVASLFVSVFILLTVLLTAAGAYKKTGIKSAPKGVQSFMEQI